MAGFSKPPSKVAEQVKKALNNAQMTVSIIEGSQDPTVQSMVDQARGRAEALAAVNAAMNLYDGKALDKLAGEQ